MVVPLSGPLSKKLANFKPPRPAPDRSVIIDVRDRQWTGADNSLSRMRINPIVVRPNPKFIGRPAKIKIHEIDRPSVTKIMRAVEIVTEVSIREQKSDRRSRSSVQARQIAMYIAKQMTGRSLLDIGACIGGRDLPPS